jgi:hypothetical protein
MADPEKPGMNSRVLSRAAWGLLPMALLASGLSRADGVAPYLPDTVAGARSIAMGDAFRAVGTSNDAIAENPAALAMAKRYELSGLFALASGAPATYWNASVVDAVTVPTALGISYEHLASSVTGTSPSNQRISGSTTRMAIAYPLSDILFIGAGLGWYTYSYTANPDRPPAKLTNSATPDVGLVLKPAEIITFAAVGYHLIDVGSPVLLPRQLAGALAIGSDQTFHLSFDAVVNLTATHRPIDYHLGGEYLLSQLLALRAGWMFEGIPKANFLSGGIGLIISSVGLDFAISQNLGNAHDHVFVLVLKGFLPG